MIDFTFCKDNFEPLVRLVIPLVGTAQGTKMDLRWSVRWEYKDSSASRVSFMYLLIVAFL